MLIDFDSRVAAGVEWLHVDHPDWREAVDRDTLDLSDFYGCLIGQLLGTYDKLDKSNEWASAHGFYIHDDEIIEYAGIMGIYFAKACEQLYGELTQAWLNELNK